MRTSTHYTPRLRKVQRELGEANHDGETDLECGLIHALITQYEIAGTLMKAAHVSSWNVLKLAAKHSKEAERLYEDMIRNDVT